MRKDDTYGVVLSGMIVEMKTIFATLLFFVSFSSVTQAAFLHEPARVFDIPVLTNVTAETIYGTLSGFPHTFIFTAIEETPFSMQVSMLGKEEFRDVSLILVKEEKRGVSEVGRLEGKKSEWIQDYNFARAVTFAEGSELTYVLEPGTYKFEVSSPENNRGYRLVLGEGDSSVFKELSMTREAFGISPLSLVFSPYVFIFLLAGLFIGYRKYKKKYVS